MKIAISQPEHFPYMGFFEKMAAADLFVVLDHVQFSGPRSFQNRNRFLNSNGKMQWFTVPVESGSYFKAIKDVRVAPDYGWRKKLFKVLRYNKFNIDYEKVYNATKLVDVNMRGIEICRDRLGISTPLINSSQMNVSGSKAELIYNICKQLGADCYISGLGAYSYMEEAKNIFTDIKVEYLHPVTKDFESSLVHISRIDILTKDREVIKQYEKEKIMRNSCSSR